MSTRVQIAIHGHVLPLALEFHPRGSACYLRLSDEAATRTVEVEDSVLADHDDHGNLVGFELLGLGDPNVVHVLDRLKRRFADDAPQLRSVEAIPA